MLVRELMEGGDRLKVKDERHRVQRTRLEANEKQSFVDSLQAAVCRLIFFTEN